MEGRSDPSDNVSTNMRETTSVNANLAPGRAAPNAINNSNLKMKEKTDAIIPERRRKYLANASEDRGAEISNFN